MQDTELFLSLAEIAGVFVGFGALIAVRSGATMEVTIASMSESPARRSRARAHGHGLTSRRA